MFGGFSASQVAFVFVLLQHLGDLTEQRRVDVAEGLGHVLVHRAFADPVASGGLADGGAVLHDVGTEDHATLLVCRYVHHAINSPLLSGVLMNTLCEGETNYP